MTREPAATDAVTVATVSGLASTLPWPIMSTACSTSLPDVGTVPPNACTPRPPDSPYPSAAAASASCCGVTLPRLPTKAALHDCAKSVRNGTVPSTSFSAFPMVRPSTVTDEGHGTGVVAVYPCLSRA